MFLFTWVFLFQNVSYFLDSPRTFGTSDMIVVTASVCNLHSTCSVAESHPSAIWQLQV